jgi:hypothetical protein
MSYSAIASKLGTSEQHVVDGTSCSAQTIAAILNRPYIVCTGNVKATQAEFDGIARVLDIKAQVRWLRVRFYVPLF